MTDKNRDYYLRRAEEELAAAEQASDPAVSNIHRQMAGLYRDMLDRETNRLDMAIAATGELAESRPIYG